MKYVAVIMGTTEILRSVFMPPLPGPLIGGFMEALIGVRLDSKGARATKPMSLIPSRIRKMKFIDPCGIV